MDKIHFEINGENEHLESIWVHLQKANYDSSVLYKIKIPVVYLEKIFDPYNTKNKTKSWEEFIEENIEELGTFIVEGYLKGMRSIAYKKRTNKKKKNIYKKIRDQLRPKSETYYKWVIATVDKISMKDNYCEWLGRAVPFQPRA